MEKSSILKEALQRLNITGRDFALMLNVSPVTVSTWITGKVKPPPEAFIYILDYENTRYREICGRLDRIGGKMAERLKPAQKNIAFTKER